MVVIFTPEAAPLKTAQAGRLLLLEAAFWLLSVRFGLALVPFHRLMREDARRVVLPEITGALRRHTCVEIRAAIRRVAPYLPGRTTCIPRAVAAQRMLRRRRIGTVLYYGAATSPECGLKAHVWLQDGEVGVIGYRAAPFYRVLARYSTVQDPCPTQAFSNVSSTP